MDRKEFLQICGGSCLGLVGISLAHACVPTKHIQSTVTNNQVCILKTEFKVSEKDNNKFRKSIITKINGLDYPVVIYRFSENSYSALLLRCSHQGNELSMNGDILSCSAHGSEFSNKGEVIQGPAEQSLQSFTVTNDQEHIYVHLK
ncbi:MAG: Rieske (2Fe-2S) protein [Bacteroidia bacterium]|nr:Rieske (2Fe-2S) protein [Bacteroidia bacterium]